ncbi:MAG: hypothetical protein WCI04_01520 [archaeon]
MEDSLFENKQFLAVFVAWFIFSFLVLWFIGGACLNPINGSACLAKGALAGLSSVPIVGLLFPFDAWNSLMYFFAPIAGFILAIIVIKWWNNNFETTEAAGISFLILILVALFLGYFINLSIYDGESAKLNSGNGAKYSLYFCFSETTSDACYSTVQKLNNEFISQAQSAGATTVSQYIPVYYWGELRKSMFLTFILGAIAGWIPLFAQSLYKKYSENKSD